MTRIFFALACLALGKLSGAVGLLPLKTRRVPVVRRLTAWLAARIGLLTWHVCSKAMREAIREDRKETVAREAYLEAAKRVVERLDEEELDHLEAALQDPAKADQLARMYPGLPDLHFFIDALKREIVSRRETTGVKEGG